LCKYLPKTKPKSKIQQVVLDAIVSIINTTRPTSEGPYSCESLILDGTRPIFDYQSHLRNLEMFNIFVKVYESNSGSSLDEMDDADNDMSENSESDEEHIPSPISVPFNVSNPHNPCHPHFSNQKFTTTNQRLSQKIASMTLKLLRDIFPNEFSEAIKNSQMESQFCAAMNGIDFGDNSKVNELADIFRNMK
jgi:hypothetical protein